MVTFVLRQTDTRDIFGIAPPTPPVSRIRGGGKYIADTLVRVTFTNLGTFGVGLSVRVINPPESAILAVGKIDKKPGVVEGAIAIRSMMRLCPAFDQGVPDGAWLFFLGARNVLENPKSSFLNWERR